MHEGWEVESAAIQDDKAESQDLERPVSKEAGLTVTDIGKSSDAHPAESNSSLRLVPIVRLSRDKIPLAWLDTTHVFDIIKRDSNAGRIFTNYSNALADWFRGADKVSKAVQIVREKTSGRLCAVERVRYGDYAICAIGSWVSEDVIISQKSVPEKQQTQLGDVAPKPVANVLQARRSRKIVDAMDRWWENKPASKSDASGPAAITPTLADHTPAEPQADISGAVTVAELDSEATPQRISSTAENAADLSQASPAVSALQQTPDLLFQRFLKQYLDALYIQRTSLAFFAKGPLARLRTAFNNVSEVSQQNDSVLNLAIFLRDMLLSTKVMERKYKEKLPHIVNDPAIGSSDRERTATSSRRKPKKLKLKPTKAGLYDEEANFARKWWLSDDGEPASSAETREQQVKRRLELLRVRETLLQTVLVLEIISLETSHEWKAAFAETQADQTSFDQNKATEEEKQSETLVDRDSEVTKDKKKSKQLDLSLHLDLLVDRVAIWHSLRFEADPVSTEMGKSRNSSKSWATDMLGAFCVDVIVPFFKHRVPEQVNMMVKKFGGPVASPEKPLKRSRQDSSRKERLPKTAGAPDKTTRRQGLQRTSTDSAAMTASKRTPGLSRASTDTSLLINTANIKLESSEAPLSAIPMLRERKAPRRDSAEKLRLLQKRTVSFNALNTSKKRKAAADEEVRAAIESIKRPNRGEVGREVADEREKRVSGASSRQVPRKALNARSNVQVAATPKAYRKINIIDIEASGIGDAHGVPDLQSDIPSSGATSRITDTVTRPKNHTAVTETPSISRVRKLDLSTTQHARESGGSLSFSKASAHSTIDAKGLPSVPASEKVFATPLKSIKWSQASPAAFVSLATPAPATDAICEGPSDNHDSAQQTVYATPQKSTSEAQSDIYTSLGWDDYGIDD